MISVLKRAFSSKDDKIIAVLYKTEIGSYGVESGFLGYRCQDVAYGVAHDDFKKAIEQADYYLHLNGKYYIIDCTEGDKQND